MATTSNRFRTRTPAELQPVPPMTAMPPDVPAAAWPAPETDVAPVTDDRETTPSGAPTYDEVARAAYALYEARGCEDGHADEDWYAAEQALRNQTSHGDRH